MATAHKQIIIPPSGNDELVIVSRKHYQDLIDKVELSEDIALYDQAIQQDTKKRISLEEYKRQRSNN